MNLLLYFGLLIICCYCVSSFSGPAPCRHPVMTSLCRDFHWDSLNFLYFCDHRLTFDAAEVNFGTFYSCSAAEIVVDSAGQAVLEDCWKFLTYWTIRVQDLALMAF